MNFGNLYASELPPSNFLRGRQGLGWKMSSPFSEDSLATMMKAQARFAECQMSDVAFHQLMSRGREITAGISEFKGALSDYQNSPQETSSSTQRLTPAVKVLSDYDMGKSSFIESAAGPSQDTNLERQVSLLLQEHQQLQSQCTTLEQENVVLAQRNVELEQHCSDLEKELDCSQDVSLPVLTAVQQPSLCAAAVQECTIVSDTVRAIPVIVGRGIRSRPRAQPPRRPRQRWSPRASRWSSGPSRRPPGPWQWGPGPSRWHHAPASPWHEPAHGWLQPGLQHAPGTFPWEPWSSPWLTHHPGGNPIPPWLRIPYWNCREIPDIIC